MSRFGRDVRFALRMLAKSPGFAVTAVLTLALGIGATTAIFTVMNTLLLRPLPYAEPGRLVLLAVQKKSAGIAQGDLSWLRTQMIRDQSRSFSEVSAFTAESFTMTGLGDPEQLAAARVSWNFFQTLGIQPLAGRFFTSAEDRPGGDFVVLIGDAF